MIITYKLITLEPIPILSEPYLLILLSQFNKKLQPAVPFLLEMGIPPASASTDAHSCDYYKVQESLKVYISRIT